MVTTRQPRDVDPFTATESLRAALDQAGVVLPSLAVGHVSPGLALVDLGRVRADVAMRLAEALSRGSHEKSAASGASTVGLLPEQRTEVGQ